MTLLGAQTILYGGIKTLGEIAPDVVALSAENDLYLVECTIGSINNKDKLNKLHLRRQAIEAKIRENQLSIRNVVPVVITNFTRDEARPDWPVAASRNIAVIGKNELAYLQNRLDAPPSAAEVYQWVTSLIPPKQEDIQL